jgi:hypothetical protein
LPEGDLPCTIDKMSFMPLLTCFHNVDAAAASPAHPSLFLDSETNITPLQCMFLHFHYKLNHISFQNLRWLLRKGLFGSLGVRASEADVPTHKCEACVTGGWQHHSIANNHKSQQHKGVLKHNQLNPCDRVFQTNMTPVS